MPLYCCRTCGFATTASWRNVDEAHRAGSPECAGELEMVVSFAGRPMESGRARQGERATASAEAPGGRRDPANDPTLSSLTE